MQSINTPQFNFSDISYAEQLLPFNTELFLSENKSSADNDYSSNESSTIGSVNGSSKASSNIVISKFSDPDTVSQKILAQILG